VRLCVNPRYFAPQYGVLNGANLLHYRKDFVFKTRISDAEGKMMQKLLNLENLTQQEAYELFTKFAQYEQKKTV
jgi:hypothetical protein